LKVVLSDDTSDLSLLLVVPHYLVRTRFFALATQMNVAFCRWAWRSALRKCWSIESKKKSIIPFSMLLRLRIKSTVTSLFRYSMILAKIRSCCFLAMSYGLISWFISSVRSLFGLAGAFASVKELCKTYINQ